MSGHSKWNNIKHKKEKSDAQKAKIFTKMGREIAVAAKAGGSDPETNGRLKDAIAKARSFNMPNDNIARVIKKAAGTYSGDVVIPGSVNVTNISFPTKTDERYYSVTSPDASIRYNFYAEAPISHPHISLEAKKAFHHRNKSFSRHRHQDTTYDLLSLFSKPTHNHPFSFPSQEKRNYSKHICFYKTVYEDKFQT